MIASDGAPNGVRTTHLPDVLHPLHLVEAGTADDAKDVGHRTFLLRAAISLLTIGRSGTALNSFFP